MDQTHVLIVTFPAQGHINPALQFAKTLARLGIQITFATSVFAIRQMTKASSAAILPKGLKFAPFSDGYDDVFKPKDVDFKEYMLGIARQGSQTIRNVIKSSGEQGCPVTCLVYTLLITWASAVACEYHIPAAPLWIQAATVLDIYYFYFHGYEDEIKNADCNDPTWSIQFPGLPLLKSKDLPSFILPSSDPKYSFVFQTLKSQIETLDEEEKPKLLVNTFDTLEPQALKTIENYDMIAIGPLTPSAFLDDKDPSDTSFGGDLFQKSKDYKEWLDSKDAASVIYVSFGSILTLQKRQMEEIASGLLKTGRPFLWVIRAKEDGTEQKEEDKLSCMEELEQIGMIVPWCSQLEVLTHPSLGCFVTHCGWNSTLESIVLGVPVVAVPHWTDQGTNAKLIEDIWRTGVRVTPNEEGTIERNEIVRCIDMVMDGGDKGLELRHNAKKIKELAREAMQDGGSSNKNLKAFLKQIISPHHLYLHPKLVVKRYQFWRLITNFLYFRKMDLDFPFHMFFLARYCKLLEENSFRGRTADFFYLLLFGATVLTGIVLVGGMIPYVSQSFARIIFLSNSLTFMMVYVWSKQNPWMQLEVKYWLEIKANQIKLDAT